MLLFTTTEREPAPTGVAEPTPLSIDADDTFEVVQERVTVLPGVTDEALALSVQIGAGLCTGTTVTGAEQFTGPPGP